LAIDVFYNDGWYEKYSGTLVNDTWIEIEIGSTENVSKARIKSNSGAGTSAPHIKEFEFWEVEAGGETFYKSLSGDLIFIGICTKKTSKFLSGALDFTGNLYSAFITFVSLSGALSFSGILSKVPTFTEGLVGTLNFAGSVTKKINKNLSGSITFVGKVTTGAARIIRRMLMGFFR